MRLVSGPWGEMPQKFPAQRGLSKRVRTEVKPWNKAEFRRCFHKRAGYRDSTGKHATASVNGRFIFRGTKRS